MLPESCRSLIRSKGEIATDLNESRSVLRGSLTEGSVRQVGVDIDKVGTVERVEDLEPELEGYAFRYFRVLQQSRIPLIEVWPDEAIIFFVSFLAECGLRELPGGKYSMEKGATA